MRVKRQEEFIDLAQRITRRRDTLHILALLLLQQAVERGDDATVTLIEDTLARLDEGDTIKQELIHQIASGNEFQIEESNA